jgi:hypothetical protein
VRFGMTLAQVGRSRFVLDSLVRQARGALGEEGNCRTATIVA